MQLGDSLIGVQNLLVEVLNFWVWGLINSMKALQSFRILLGFFHKYVCLNFIAWASKVAKFILKWRSLLKWEPSCVVARNIFLVGCFIWLKSLRFLFWSLWVLCRHVLWVIERLRKKCCYGTSWWWVLCGLCSMRLVWNLLIEFLLFIMVFSGKS